MHNCHLCIHNLFYLFKYQPKQNEKKKKKKKNIFNDYKWKLLFNLKTL